MNCFQKHSRRYPDLFRARGLFFALFCLLGATTSLVAQSDPVERGQEAFKSYGEWDWYDSSSDSIRPVAPPSPSKNNGRNGGSGGSGGSGSGVPGSSSSGSGSSMPSVPIDGSGLQAFGTIFKVIAWIVVIAFLVAIAVGIVWAIMKMDWARKGDEVEEELDEPDEIELNPVDKLPFEIDKSIGNFLDAARQAYQQQDYRKSTIYLFSHTLLTLDLNQLIRLTRGKTNRQYLAELRENHEIKSFYEQVMIRFEAAFFGDRDITKEQFEIIWNQVDRFHHAVQLRIQQRVTHPHFQPAPA